MREFEYFPIPQPLNTENLRCFLSINFQRLADAFRFDWNVYTSVWSAVTNPVALGNGSLKGKYVQRGKLVRAKISFTAGSTTTFGTGGWRFSLPVPAKIGGTEDIADLGIARLSDASPVTTRIAVVRVASSTLFALDTEGLGGVDFDTPWVWANGDSLILAITYEAA